jgi:hypothetical protein
LKTRSTTFCSLLILLLAANSVHAEAPAKDETVVAEATPESAPAEGAEGASGAPNAEAADTSPESTEAADKAAEAAREEAKAAEDEKPKVSAAEKKAQDEAAKNNISKLVTKLKDKDGKLVKVALMTTIDYTTLNFSELANVTALATIRRYGDFDIQRINELLPALTLQAFRRVVVKNKVDVVMVAVLKPTNFDLFLFDRRTPYHIYAHSETLPEEVQYALTGPIVEEYTKVIVRRILYAYLQDQYYELPREENQVFTSAEVPRWIASAQNFATINREILSRFYGSVGVGAALAVGNNGGVWNSNLVGLQLGMRLIGQLYAEGAVNMFAYNAFLLSGKYLFSNRDNPFRFSLGMGVASASNQHTIAYDPKFTQGLSGSYVVPSASFIFPIVDIHFKVESQLLIGLGGGRAIFTLMPGLLLMF